MIHIFFVFNYLNDLCDSNLQTDKKNNNASICVLLNDNQEKEKNTRKKTKEKEKNDNNNSRILLTPYCSLLIFDNQFPSVL